MGLPRDTKVYSVFRMLRKLMFAADSFETDGALHRCVLTDQ